VRSACIRLLEEWGAAADDGQIGSNGSGAHRRFSMPATAASSASDPPEVEAACARILADPGLRPEALMARIEELAGAGLEGVRGEALARLLSGLDEQSQQLVAQDDPGNWARQALGRVRDWLGSGVSIIPGREAGRVAQEPAGPGAGGGAGPACRGVGPQAVRGGGRAHGNAGAARGRR
jgi:hypothetical protein